MLRATMFHVKHSNTSGNVKAPRLSSRQTRRGTIPLQASFRASQWVLMKIRNPACNPKNHDKRIGGTVSKVRSYLSSSVWGVRRCGGRGNAVGIKASWSTSSPETLRTMHEITSRFAGQLHRIFDRFSIAKSGSLGFARDRLRTATPVVSLNRSRPNLQHT